MGLQDMKQGLTIGSTFTWTLKSPSLTLLSSVEFNDFVEDHLDGVDEDAFIKGNVIYDDGESAIIEIKEMTKSLFPFTLFYNEVKNRFPDLECKNENPYQKYLCLDIASMTSLFFYDEGSGYMADAVYDAEGTFDYYDLPDSEAWNDDLEKPESMFPEQIVIELDESTINEYEEKDALVQTDEQNKPSGDDDALLVVDVKCSWHRAVSWFNTRDCAVLTAWRNGKGRKVNDDNNRELQQQLRNLGYGVTKLTGWYAEEGKDYERENSYLTVNLNDEEDFREKIFKLSEHYEQDSFLYKEAGNDKPALYIYTNDVKGKGKVELLGRLRIGNMDAKAYSQIKAGRITFE